MTATVVLYAPLIGLGAGFGVHAVVRRQMLRATVHSMRTALASSEVSQFESHVLVAMLTKSRVAAQRESRLLLVSRAPQDVVLSVLEYDMSKIEHDHPTVGG